MYLRGIHQICLWLTAGAVMLMSARLSLSQAPEVLAEASLGEFQLELYTAIKKPFGLDGKERPFVFVKDEQLNAITDKLTFGPWGRSEGSKLSKDEYVLGFLVRNAQGEIPVDTHQLATAFRVTVEGGKVESDWPRGGQANPLSEVNGYEWNYRLAPMVIQVPKGAQRIEKLEGALVVVPKDETVISLTKEDIDNRAAAYARQVVVFALDAEQTGQGNVYSFVVCRSEKGKSATSKQDEKNRLESVEIQITGRTSSGERVRPNLRANIQINETVRRKIVSEVVSNMRKQPSLTAVEEATLTVLTDPNAVFNVSRVGFQREKILFDQVDIAVNVTTGAPKLLPFEINNISLPTIVDKEVINQFVASQPVARPTKIKIESPLQFRNWSDVTGAFSVEAKLLGLEAQSVQLEKKNGEIIKVPIAKLSQADRDYVTSSSNSGNSSE